MIGVLLSTVAAAQTIPVPEVASDLFRPALGSIGLVTESARVPADALAGVFVSGAGPTLEVLVDGEPRTLVHEVVGVHLGARFGIGPVQLGVDAPAYVVSRTENSRALLGDPSVLVKVAGGGASWGVGGMARIGTSLGASARGLGYPGPFGELAALGEGTAGPLHVGANLGVRFVPSQSLADVELDDVAFGRLALGIEASEVVHPFVELAGQVSLPSDTAAGPAPIEVMAGVAVRSSHGSLQLGVGRGLTSAVGTPGWRFLLGLTWAAPPAP